MNLETTTYRNHNTYGGEILESDFNTNYGETRNIAERIVSDWQTDEQYRKNIEETRKKGE